MLAAWMGGKASWEDDKAVLEFFEANGSVVDEKLGEVHAPHAAHASTRGTRKHTPAHAAHASTRGTRGTSLRLASPPLAPPSPRPRLTLMPPSRVAILQVKLASVKKTVSSLLGTLSADEKAALLKAL